MLPANGIEAQCLVGGSRRERITLEKTVSGAETRPLLHPPHEATLKSSA
jgi:hypothetical protein